MEDDASPRQRSIDSRSGFVAAVHEVLDLALARRTRRMLWVDADFAGWPLDDAILLRRLTHWLRLPQRQLLLLAGDYAVLCRSPRFMACYRLWSHAIAAHAPAEDDVAQLPCLLLAERAALVQLMDKSHWRGWIAEEAASLRSWHERVDALLQRSEPAFPATTLGL